MELMKGRGCTVQGRAVSLPGWLWAGETLPLVSHENEVAITAPGCN